MDHRLVANLLYCLCKETDSTPYEVTECLSGILLSEEEMGQIREDMLRGKNQMNMRLFYDDVRNLENEEW